MMRIGILNTSTSYTTAYIAAAVPAMNSFLVEFAKYWPEAQGAEITYAPGPELTGYPIDMLVTVQENTPPNGIGDLAYHTPGGNGNCFVFAGVIKAVGADLIAAIMHEIMEALVNPTCRRMAPDGLRLMEVCDPVQETFVACWPGGRGLAGPNNEGYLMPNFVTPWYFNLGPVEAFDYNGQLHAAEPLPGGSQMHLDSTHQHWLTQLGLVEPDHPSHVVAGLTWRQMKSVGRLAYARCLPHS